MDKTKYMTVHENPLFSHYSASRTYTALDHSMQVAKHHDPRGHHQKLRSSAFIPMIQSVPDGGCRKDLYEEVADSHPLHWARLRNTATKTEREILSKALLANSANSLKEQWDSQNPQYVPEQLFSASQTQANAGKERRRPSSAPLTSTKLRQSRQQERKESDFKHFGTVNSTLWYTGGDEHYGTKAYDVKHFGTPHSARSCSSTPSLPSSTGARQRRSSEAGARVSPPASTGGACGLVGRPRS